MSVRSVRVQVPGSSANLGPGFDVLAAALAMTVNVEVVETGSFQIVTDLHLRRDRNNLIVRGFERLLPADTFEFRVSSGIPLSGGLGSSAAGVVAGLLAAQALTGSDADLLVLATEIEGHPDNVAASLLGGLVVCDGTDVTRLEMPAALQAVLVVPGKPVKTSLARQALPAAVPMVDAVANVAAASKLMLGLAGGDFELISRGLRDRLHQPYRAHLYPASARLVEQATDHGALGATISGAGPTVLVWSTRDSCAVVRERIWAEAHEWAQVLIVDFEAEGAHVLETAT